METTNSEYSRLSDDELVVLFRKNDQLAFEEIVFRYINLIAFISSKYRTEGFETNDFIQEGLLALLNACNSYKSDGAATFKNYSGVCIENRFKSILRKTQTKTAIPSENVVSIDNTEVSDNNATNPEQLYFENEYIKNINELIECKLSALERQVFHCYLAGYSYDEISQRLSLAPKAVDNALQRIRKKLRSDA